jgi:hypothetical protein
LRVQHLRQASKSHTSTINTALGVALLQVSDNINVFVSTAEGFVRDLPPEQVAVPSVTELSKEAFVAGVTGTAVVREHIKLNLLHAARLEEDDAEAQVRVCEAAAAMA